MTLNRSLLNLSIMFVALSAVCMAQVSSGTISGSVRDSSGGAVVGAKVEITQLATTEKRQTVTNERGEFNAPYLHVGAYSVAVSMSGFKSEVSSGIVLQVDQIVNLTMVLQPGATSESIEVSGTAPLIDTSTSSLGQVIDNTKINDLPLNGRNVWALGLLSGNSVPVKGVASNLPFVAGGGRFQTNDILPDGIDNNTVATGGGIGVVGINYTPSVDAIVEFKVKTNNYSAEYGRSAGAIVSATIKSGTNDYTGDCWEFLRNDVLDANNFFSNAAGKPKQPYKQNQFGCTLGGPVVIPRLYNGHINKAFTSRAFDIATKDLAQHSQSGGQFSGIHVSNHGRAMIFAGGIPLKRDGRVVGAVGVSGGSGEQDHVVAQAGADAFQI